jgi:site-specific recombinase XerD
VLLAEAIETFILYKRAENLSERTIVWYEHQLAIFAASQPATKTLSEVSATDIARYLAEQADPARKPPLSAATVQARYRTIHAFFNWCEGSRDLGKPESPMGHRRHKAVAKPRGGAPAQHYVPFEDYTHFMRSIEIGTWQDARSVPSHDLILDWSSA